MWGGWRRKLCPSGKSSCSIKLHSEIQVWPCPGSKSPWHVQNHSSGEWRKTLSITHHANHPYVIVCTGNRVIIIKQNVRLHGRMQLKISTLLSKWKWLYTCVISGKPCQIAKPLKQNKIRGFKEGCTLQKINLIIIKMTDIRPALTLIYVIYMTNCAI